MSKFKTFNVNTVFKILPIVKKLAFFEKIYFASFIKNTKIVKDFRKKTVQKSNFNISSNKYD